MKNVRGTMDIQGFQQAHIIREDAAAAVETAVTAVQALHGIGGIKHLRLCSIFSVNATSVTKSEISRFRSRRPLPPDPYVQRQHSPRRLRRHGLGGLTGKMLN